MCCKKFDEKVKKLSACDVGWIKLASMAFILVVIKGIRLIWDWNLLEHVSIWWFVVLFVLFSLKPALKFFGKSGGHEVKGGENVPPEV